MGSSFDTFTKSQNIQQRSGSGWFETLLNSYINVSSSGEILGLRDRSNISSILETVDRVYNLDCSSASKHGCSAAVGFKWMLNNQGVTKHHENIVKCFKKNGVSAIFLFQKEFASQDDISAGKFL